MSSSYIEFEADSHRVIRDREEPYKDSAQRQFTCKAMVYGYVTYVSQFPSICVLSSPSAVVYVGSTRPHHLDN